MIIMPINVTMNNDAYDFDSEMIIWKAMMMMTVIDDNDSKTNDHEGDDEDDDDDW